MPNPLDDRQVYTLADLTQWEQLRPGLPPSLAVLGHPVAHSVSPQMHNAALAELTKQHPQLKDWKYFKFDIKEDELEDAFGLLQGNKFAGVNLTVPHKETAAIILSKDNISTKGVGIEKTYFDPSAIDAANTVIFTQNGIRKVFNTDGYGMAQAIKQNLKIDLRKKVVVIFGIGGASSSVADECLNRGCTVLWVGGRNEQKRLNFVGRVNAYINREIKSDLPTKIEIHDFSLSEPPVNKWPEDVVVINATTLGMKPDDPLPLDVSLLGNKACVFDMVYNRGGPTRFVAEAKARRLQATDGLGMLVWQGAKSLTIWIKAHEGIVIKPEDIAQTMMDAACAALGLPPRHA